MRATHFVSRARSAVAAIGLAALAACGIGMDDAELLQRARSSMQTGEYRAAVIDLKDFLQRNREDVQARLALGEASLKIGDAASAVRELRLARDGGAAPDAVLPTLVQALMAQESFEEALREADISTVRSPEIKRSLLRMRGNAFLGLDQPGAAAAEFEAALALDPRDLTAILGLASARMATAGLAPALELVDQVLAIDPQHLPARLARGTLYLRDRQFDLAARTFTDAQALAERSESRSEQLAALAGLTEAQLGAGEVQAALATSERMKSLAPPNRITHYLRARVLFLAGRFDEARTLLEELTSRDANDHRARLLLGAVSYAQGNFGQADMYFASVVAADPGNAFARQMLADTRLRQHKPQDAYAALLPATREPDADPRLLALASRASLQAGDAAAAVELLGRGAAASGADRETQLELAAGYLAAGEFDAAARLLEGVPDSKAGEFQRELLLAVTRANQNDLEGALELGRELVSKYPREATVQVLLGSLLATSGKLTEAREHFAAAVREAPANPAMLVNLGRLDLLEGRAEEAEKHFHAAFDLKPGNPAASVALARLALARGEPEQARRWLEQSRVANPDAIEPRVQLAQFLLATRDFANAGQLAREALALAPGNVRALNALAMALSGSGKHEEAIASLKKAVDASPRSAQLRFNLARTYLLAARPDEAAAAARQAIDLDADHYPALAMLAALSARGGWSADLQKMISRMKELAPNQSHAHLLEAEFFMQRRQYAEAARAYEAVIARQANNALALNNLAWAYHSQRDARALETARRAFQLAGQRVEIADTYAWLLVESGRTAEGLEILRDIGGPGAHADIRLHLATALARTGEEKEARAIAGELARDGAVGSAAEGARELLESLGDG